MASRAYSQFDLRKELAPYPKPEARPAPGPSGKGDAPRWNPAGGGSAPTWHMGNTFYVAKDGVMNGPGKSMKPGGGGRFAKLEKSIAARGDVRDPGAVAAAIGRAKYGKKKFQQFAAKGRRRAD